MSAHLDRPHRVVVVVYDDVELLDVTGPISVLSAATRVRGRAPGGYEIVLAATRAGSITTSGGVTLRADRRLATLRGPIDTLVVPGSLGISLGASDRELVPAIAQAAKRAARVVSVCTGAFLLAEAGLLDGRRATTHWAACETLRKRFPTCSVEADAIFVRDGSLWTSAGVSAGIDLALALVEHDHDRELALTVARWLVVYLKRPGGQTQFSAPLAAQRADREALRDLLAWMREHPAADLRVPALARRAGMSERNFARVFRGELGATPAAYVETLRLEHARRGLETTKRPTKRIARDAGFGSVETLHRVFRRSLDVTPAEYRRRFST